MSDMEELVSLGKVLASLDAKIDGHGSLLTSIRKDLDRLIETRGLDAVAIAKLQRDIVALEKDIKEHKQTSRRGIEELRKKEQQRSDSESKRLAALAAAVTALSTALSTIVPKLPIVGS